jgi:peptidoglycan/xylan/chitin deacetylase (PgdA/CDA1 family)
MRTPLSKKLRRIGRRIGIDTTTALRLDNLARASERRDMRRRSRPFVRVLFLHETPAEEASRFRQQLSFLRDHFTVIDFDTFKNLFDGSAALPDDRPAAMLTFDDGMASNYEVAAPLLEDAGMRGVFFVVPRFSLCDERAARRFYVERVRNRPPGLTAMTPEQIRDLADRGHTIGNHTLTHARLSQTPESEWESEILDSADIIESWIGRRVEAFSWPFRWDAITPDVHRLAIARHPLCFSPCSGRVDLQTDSPTILWRTSVETSYDLAEFRFKCSRLADYVSASRRRRLASWLRANARASVVAELAHADSQPERRPEEIEIARGHVEIDTARP